MPKQFILKPTESGVYRMFTTSGNKYFVVVDAEGYGNGDLRIDVFQPIRFKSETYMSASWKDISRNFAPTSFERLHIAELNESDTLRFATDLETPSMPSGTATPEAEDREEAKDNWREEAIWKPPVQSQERLLGYVDKKPVFVQPSNEALSS